MTHTHTNSRYAFVKANWHADIVGRALDGFIQGIPAQQVDVFKVPGAFELPLTARGIALSGQYAAIAAAALVVDGGIHRQEFVARAVVDGLMRHFLEKGREAAEATLMIGRTRAALVYGGGAVTGRSSL